MSVRDDLVGWASDWQYLVMHGVGRGAAYVRPHGSHHSITLFKLLRNARKAAGSYGRTGTILRFVPSLLPSVDADEIIAPDDADELQFAERMASLWMARAHEIQRERLR